MRRQPFGCPNPKWRHMKRAEIQRFLTASCIVAHAWFLTGETHVAADSYFPAENLRWTYPSTNGLARGVDLSRDPLDFGHASEDPFGNWGWPSAGFQMSLRFDQQEYRPGEKVTAHIRIRNVSDQKLPLGFANPYLEHEFVVIRGRDQIVSRRPETLGGFTSATSDSIPTRGQVTRDLDLGHLFDLSNPGEYLVYVKRYVASPNGYPWNEVRSGSATFRIVAPPSSEADVADSAPSSDNLTDSATPFASDFNSGRIISRATLAKPAAAPVPPAGKSSGEASQNGSSSTGPSSSSAPPMVVGTTTFVRSWQGRDSLFSAIVFLLLSVAGTILWRAHTRRKAGPG